MKSHCRWQDYLLGFGIARKGGIEASLSEGRVKAADSVSYRVEILDISIDVAGSLERKPVLCFITLPHSIHNRTNGTMMA